MSYLTFRALVDLSLLDPLAKPLAKVAVSQVPQEHVPTAEVAAAQGAGLPVRLLGLQGLENGLVVGVQVSGSLVQKLDDHLVVDAVMPHQQLEVLGLEVADLDGASERGKRGQVKPEPFHEVFVGGVTDEVVGVEERRVADGASDLQEHSSVIPLVRSTFSSHCPLSSNQHH